MNTTTQNHFALFGLPVSYEVDLNTLSEHYRELQRTVHPDKFANASNQERRISVQKAAQINEAFQTLKSPIRRARYILEMRGVEFDDQRDNTVDPMFLMEQIELREALAEIPKNDQGLMKLGSLQDDIQQKVQQLTSELGELLSEDSDEAMNRAKSNLHKLQFMDKLQQEAENVEEDIANSL
ncbi:MAG: Fe-S protein assembly co-chaperone HscB [Gammaproteobacteria bacterium]|nr:Fe-S protein assembly co-chaperone HscB [Gammaproteobacteria bacterium]